MAHLSLSLLGPFQVTLNGNPVAGFRSDKERALLAYLAIEANTPHRRASLVGLLWPDCTESAARNNLRQALFRLRKAIEDRTPSGDPHASPPFLLTTRTSIQFNPASDYWLDVAAFTALLSACEAHRHHRLETCQPCLKRLQQAIELYRGDFLKDFFLADSAAFEEWAMVTREQLHLRALEALRILADYHEGCGVYDHAQQFALRQVELMPWREAAHRQLMRVLALRGERSAALAQYETCRRLLAEELGVEPEAETLALVEQIRAGALVDMRPRIPITQLPSPATPFVGREAERKRLSEYLASQDQRLITVYGLGGSGKTRLALEVAAEQAPLWPDGVWFVPLAEVPAADGLVDALAAALNLRAEGAPPKPQQLIDFLRAKESLLILDSFEHLTVGTPLLRDIVRWAPQVRILLTSRARLGLQGEWAMQLGGLDVPPPPPLAPSEGVGAREGVDIESYSAVQLFVQSARRVVPDFTLSPANLPHVVRICHLVVGLPLGIELAAAWVRLFPCRQIADEIARSPDFLHNPGGNPSGRQHSLRATFEYSYTLLSDTGQSLFRKLSVFHGGFTVEAAWQIADATPSGLASLLDKSLLQTSPSGRLDVHLTLRDYAAEKLAESPREEEAIREGHGCFYLAFLREREEAIRGEHQKEVLDEIGLEIGNVRAAWRWAAAQARVSEIDASMPGLSRFYIQTSLLREGETTFGDAADRLLAFATEDGETRRVAGQLRLKQASFLFRRGRYPQLVQAAQAAIELAQTAQDAVSEAYGTFYRGAALWSQGEYEPARTQLERARSLARAARGDAAPGEGRTAAKVEGRCLNLLAGVCWNQGRHAEAKTYLEQMLPIFTRLGDQISKAAALGNLGILASDRGDYAEAKTRYEQSLRIHQEVGHPEGQSTGHVNLGELYLSLGAYAEAEAHLQQALDINREIGAGQREAMVLTYLGLLSHYLGEDEPAREYSQQALKLAQEVGDRRRQGMAWMMLGHALLGLERLEEAVEAYRESVTLRREMGWHNVAMEPLAGLAGVALAQGHYEQAQMHVEEILSHLETGTRSAGSGHGLDGTINPFQVYLTCYQVLRGNGDRRAGEVLTTAHELLQERAAKITDEGIRRSFLKNVAAQREIVSEFSRATSAGVR